MIGYTRIGSSSLKSGTWPLITQMGITGEANSSGTAEKWKVVIDPYDIYINDTWTTASPSKAKVGTNTSFFVSASQWMTILNPYLAGIDDTWTTADYFGDTLIFINDIWTTGEANTSGVPTKWKIVIDPEYLQINDIWTTGEVDSTRTANPWVVVSIDYMQIIDQWTTTDAFLVSVAVPGAGGTSTPPTPVAPTHGGLGTIGNAGTVTPVVYNGAYGNPSGYMNVYSQEILVEIQVKNSAQVLKPSTITYEQHTSAGHVWDCEIPMAMLINPPGGPPQQVVYAGTGYPLVNVNVNIDPRLYDPILNTMLDSQGPEDWSNAGANGYIGTDATWPSFKGAIGYFTDPTQTYTIIVTTTTYLHTTVDQSDPGTEVYRNIWKSPPVVIKTWHYDFDKEVVVIHGIDQTSYLWNTEGYVGPIFQSVPASTILLFMAQLTQTNLFFAGGTINENIETFTLHSGSLLTHLSRICLDFGFCWYVEAPSGAIVVSPIGYAAPGRNNLYTDKYTQTSNNDALTQYIRFNKQSRTSTNFALTAYKPGIQGPTDLPAPLDARTVRVTPQNVSGSAVYVQFLNAAGAPVNYFRFNQLVPSEPTVGEGTATKAVWSVLAPQGPQQNNPTYVRIIVGGKSPGLQAQYDQVFEADYPEQIPWVEPLLMSATFLNVNQDITNASGIFYPPKPNGLDYVNGSPPQIYGDILGQTTKFKVINVSSSLWPTFTDMSVANGSWGSNVSITVPSNIVTRLWIYYQKDWNKWNRSLGLFQPDIIITEYVNPDSYSIYGTSVEHMSWTINDQGFTQTIDGYYPLQPSGNAPVEIGQKI